MIMERILRIQLDIDDLGLLKKNRWVSVDQSTLNTISDFKCLLSKKLNLSSNENINLYVKKCLLPDDETILILRDEDVVRLVYEEQLSLSQFHRDGRGNKDEKIASSEQLGSKRKHDKESHRTKKQKLLSSSVANIPSQAISDSETVYANNIKDSNVSENEQQDTHLNFQECITHHRSRKHKREKKIKKHSQQDLEELTSIATPVHDAELHVKMCDVSECDSKIGESVIRHIHSLAPEKAKVAIMHDDTCKDYSLLSLESEKDDENVTNNMNENLVKSDSSMFLNKDISEVSGKDSNTELGSRLSPEDKPGELLENNCPRRKRKRRRKRKECNSLIISGNLNTNTGSEAVVSSTPKDVIQTLQYGFNSVDHTYGVKGPIAKHTFFHESLEENDTVVCEQPTDVNKTSSVTEASNGNNKGCIEVISPTSKPCNEVKLSGDTKNTESYLQNTLVACQELIAKNLQAFLVGNSPEKSLTKSYSMYPPLKSFPSVGSIIAYKILELSSSYCPEISDYKEGKVINIHGDTDDLEIELLNKEIIVREGKFENIYPEDCPEPDILTKVTVNWTALIEPKLIHWCN